LLHKESMRTAQ